MYTESTGYDGNTPATVVLVNGNSYYMAVMNFHAEVFPLGILLEG